MGVFAGPDIPESGLILALDARNNKSHSSNRFISYGSGLVTQGIGFQVNGDGTFQRVAAGTAIGGYTVKTTDVVYSYVLGSNGCHYHGNDIPIPAGVYATFSFDYLVTGATNYPLTNFLASFENAFGNSIGTANNLQDVWQRRTFTSGPTGSAGTLRMLLYPGGCGVRLADSGTLYFRNPKVEFTNVDTGDGNFSSMSNLTTWTDTSSNGSIGTLINGPQYYNEGYLNFDGTNDYIQLPITGTYTQISFDFWGFFDDATLSTTSRNESAFGDWTSNQVHFGTRWSVGMHWNVNNNWVEIPNTNLRYGWNHYSLIYDTISNQKLVYLNGILSSSQGANGSIVLGDFKLGVATALGYYYRGNISNFKIYNRALSAAEIQQNFSALRGRFGL